MADLTVIIPARNETYLGQTIQNVLDNSRGDTNIYVILDGYLPEPQLHFDERVIFVHHEESIGQRQGINEAARMTDAKFIMKLDAHCAVAEGFDIELMNSCEYDVTMIPRMYNLDIHTFTPKLHKRTDYMYIGWNDKEEIRALYYNGRQPDTDKEIDDIMCCMGPCFFMHRERFWELGGCDENHGSWGQQGIELACKAWLSGGKLQVNKRTWFSHWFRGGEGPGFPYHLSGRQVKAARNYSKDLWLNDKWEQAVRPFQFLIDKFNPPGWNDELDTSAVRLELGCGKKKRKPGFINVDLRALPNVDVVMDIRKLDYDTASVDMISNTDVLEHFGRAETQPILKEWLRVLKPGGKIEIQVPDVGRTMDAWRTMPVDDMMNAILGAQAYEYDFHKMLFTKETLVQHLKDAGYVVDGIKRFSIRGLPRMRVYGHKP